MDRSPKANTAAIKDAVSRLLKAGSLSQLSNFSLHWLTLAVQREQTARKHRDAASLEGIRLAHARKAARVRRYKQQEQDALNAARARARSWERRKATQLAAHGGVDRTQVERLVGDEPDVQAEAFLYWMSR